MPNLQKQKIRAIMKQKRNALEKHDIEKFSKQICEKLFTLKIFDFDNFFIYKSFGSEVETDQIISKLFKLKKRIFTPKILKNDMKSVEILQNTVFFKNKIGILEPDGEFLEINNFVAIMPCLAVSKTGNRIGFGGGFYDRFLQNIDALKIVVCYDFQVVQEFEPEQNDIPVDIVVTEKRVIYCKENQK